MAQQIKALAAKLDNLCLSSRNKLWKERNNFYKLSMNMSVTCNSPLTK